ncbi:hypothetical protein AMES_9213 [Amycolatopsis mediterranei S699]|uniref:Anti-sigma factor n=2 Tax=Amycolatopsis mediterranei TaxID=33910 RepID=A0A0H3DJK9_AMYMU|nr:hypothetical protein [Amycolatopsis mediterranei]ADJ51040.1 conserved hypothetical protein [Amycolatopsis mediterranei U32]AEK48056.1 hypothetical protein RAM_47955 [Amycolatopsis mediterranei S699]AFO82745.1 hypothetical protein AMES_9213 [Amycolatopsis mediterranei S699]KDO11964.1 hypothetical protein DV26_02675 [Amycolatopsis mediterranei]KDU91171.1 hypothetical protein DV36_13985 [Amycolatopsis mediterranei]
MTDESRGIGGTIGPPWSVDVLADLHAGVLDDTRAAELWPLVNADPEARAILDALDATQADLASLAEAPAPRMPAEFAARLDAALAAEAAAAFPGRTSPGPRGVTQAPGPAGPGNAPVVDLAAARRRRNKRLGWAAGVLTAAAAAVVAVTIAIPDSSQQTGTPNVAAPAPTGPSVGSDGAGAQALVGKAIGVRDFGPLQNEDRLDACIAAAGLDPKVRPEGIRPVNVGGKAGVMIILTTGKLAQFRLVAFGADCGPGNPAVLFDKVVGEK